MIYSAIMMIIFYSNFVSPIELADSTEYQEKISWAQYVYTEGAYPYYASIQEPFFSSYSHFCGGALISTRIMLTAAHCLMNASLIHSYRILPNYRNTPLMMEGQDLVLKISGYMVHPESNIITGLAPRYAHDIAVVFLDRADARRDASILLPAIPLLPCVPVKLIGFGLTETGDYPHRLKEATVYALTDQECVAEAGLINYAPIINICTTNRVGSSACPGDSGGPLIWENPSDNKSYIYGIVSNGRPPCRGFYVTVYVNVYEHLNFIIHAILRLTLNELSSVQTDHGQLPIDNK